MHARSRVIKRHDDARGLVGRPLFVGDAYEQITGNAVRVERAD